MSPPPPPSFPRVVPTTARTPYRRADLFPLLPSLGLGSSSSSSFFFFFLFSFSSVSVGIEYIEDIKADFVQAFDASANVGKKGPALGLAGSA